MGRVIGWASGTLMLVLALGALWFAALPAPEPLRLGTNVWIGYEPLHVAAERGALPKSLELVEYVSSTQVLNAFLGGDIDAAALTLDESLRLWEATHDAMLVLVTDRSNGADALVARPGRSTLAGLKGARVGVERTALGAFVLGRALDRGGLGLADVQVVPLTINEHVDAYDAGVVDAVVTFEPELTHLQALGASVLFSSKDIPGEVVDVLVVRRSTAQRHPELVAELRRAWFTARAWALGNPAEFARLGSQRLQVTPDELPRQLDGIELPGEAESDGAVQGGLLPVGLRIAQSLGQTGIVSIPEAEVRAFFASSQGGW